MPWSGLFPLFIIDRSYYRYRLPILDSLNHRLRITGLVYPRGELGVLTLLALRETWSGVLRSPRPGRPQCSCPRSPGTQSLRHHFEN